MPTLVKHGSNGLKQFLDAPSIVYGDGSDGNVNFDGSSTVFSIAPSSSVYQLTRDIFCYNMLVGANVRVQPNGYRIFVKNLLQLSDNSVIGWASNTGWSTAGSIMQGGNAGESVTHSLGGATGPGISTAGTATPPASTLGGSNYYRQPLNAILGYAISASSGPVYLRGGAGGSVSSGSKGGGVIICAARYISGPPSGTALFRADSDGGSSSIAGNGVIITISTQSALPATVGTSLNGGISFLGLPTYGTPIHIQAQ
jgi:hypothetical protein